MRDARIGEPIDLGEQEFTKPECVVGLVCHIYRDRKRHTGKIVKVHSVNGMTLYRFQSPNHYVLVSRGELFKENQ